MIHQKQDLTFTIYPPDEEPEIWHLQAYVFGDWAVHRAHPEELGEYPWVVSHAPTGVAGFESNKFGVAIQAAKKLAGMQSPSVTVVTDEKEPHIAPLPMSWIAQSAELLDGMDIWCRTGWTLKRPHQLVEYIAKVRARKAHA